MPADDKRDFLVPGGGLGSRLLPRAVGAVESTEPDRDARTTDENAILGTRIDSCRILFLLGSGGMGSVYLADHTDASISRRVALKIMRNRYGTGARERFARERRMLASLAHPHIAALYDSGETATGALYYTMEYVQGDRITTYCREHVPTVAGRIEILRDVAGALACAHRSLIIHRDIKPSNVLVSADGHAKLLDFGIAKSLVESTDPGLTQNSTGPMTPQYAAPEQFHGGTLTVATDVYQFGVLMFHVLTGRLPLRADPRDPVAWAHAVAEEEPLSLTRALHLTATGDRSGDDDTGAWASGTRLSGIRHALGGDLEAIVAKALAKDPQQRYVSMEALSADLGAFLEGRPVQARRAGVLYRMRRFAMRNRAASLVALIALAALAVETWLAIDRLRVERDRATAASTTARATTDFLVNLFSVADPGENRGERLTADQILERGARQLEEHPADDPGVDAAVAVEIGRVYTSLGERKRAKALLDAALARSEHLPPSSPQRVRLFLMRGWVNYLGADYASAAADYDQARALLPRIQDPAERLNQEGALAQRDASLLRRTGKLDAASAAIHHAIDVTTPLRGADNPAMGPSWNELGIIERDRGDHDASIAAFRHALDLYRTHYGPLDTRTLGTAGNLAEVLVLNDRSEEAEPLLLDCAEKARKLQDGPSLLLATCLDMLSQVRIDQKRFEEAEKIASETADDYGKVLGPRHNYRSFALVHLGAARLGKGDGPGALAAFNEALDLRREAFGHDHRDVANALSNLGDAEMQLGDAAAGAPHLREALAIDQRVLPADHVAIPRVRIKLVPALIALKQFEDAAHELRAAREEFGRARDATDNDRAKLRELDDALASARTQPGAIDAR